jgi:hypothetical protein
MAALTPYPVIRSMMNESAPSPLVASNVQSAVGSPNEDSALSSLYVEKDGAVFCNMADGDSIERGVIDVMSFSTDTIFLLRSGNIVREKQDGTRMLISSYRYRMTRLEKHMGQAYGLCDGILYRLEINSYNTGLWKWEICTWTQPNIVYTSSTLDAKYLWLQTSNGTGTLYDHNLNVVKMVSSYTMRRRYGYTVDQYTETDLETCKTSVNIRGIVSTYNEVCCAAMNHDGKLITLSPTDISKYVEIRMVKWKPYYIQQA